MDTKSKSIKYAYGTKVMAFCLMLVFTLLAGYLGGEITKTVCIYGQASLESLSKSSQEESKISKTEAFESQVVTDLEAVASAGVFSDWTKYLNGNYITKEEEMAFALEELEHFRQKSQEKAEAERESQYSSSSGYGDTTDASGTPATVAYEYNTNVYSDFYTTVVGKKSITFDMSTTEEELTAQVSDAYDNAVSTAKRNFAMQRTANNQTVQEFKDFKFYAVSKDGSAVFTNMTDSTGSIQEVKDSLSKNDFYVFYTAENGLVGSKGLSDFEYSRFFINNGNGGGYAIPGSNYGFGREFISDTVISDFASNDYDIYISVTEPFTTGSNYYNIQQDFNFSVAGMSESILTAAVFLAFAFALFIYLVLVTGRANGVAGVKMSFIDRVPTDIHLITGLGLMAVACAVMYLLIEELFYNSLSAGLSWTVVYTCGFAVAFAAICVVGTELVTSIARYVKSGKSWIRQTLTVKSLRWVVRCCRKCVRPFKNMAGNLKYKTKKLGLKVFVFAIFYLLINIGLLFVTAAVFDTRGLDIWPVALLGILVCFNALVMIFIRKYLILLDKIIVSSERNENGETVQIDGIEDMPEPLKTLANNLNFTQDEMQRAVDEAIKGEKMKTELITNVSHDLKTPLTSIISYVDLLKKCDIDDVSAQKYINVLDEKSIRLKRLIEDLVEASKVSSGAVSLNKVKVNLYELTVQAIGEMEDAFTGSNLEIILSDCKEALPVFADSQKAWRIIDNLLTNAKKYSLEGTRIYISISKDDKFGIVTIKNTSRDALNIDPNELTERFVRGDASRSREGSGLGLSIAKDLCILQGGLLDISIDGDLFKATVKLPLCL